MFAPRLPLNKRGCGIADRRRTLVVVGHRPQLPPVLLEGPFTVEDARAAGLERWHLEGSIWRRIDSATYLWSGLADSPDHRLAGALRRLPGGAAFSGRTAAWLHRLDANASDLVEVTVPPGSGISARSGIKLHRSPLAPGEVVTVRGFPTTSMLRTVTDLCARPGLTEAVVIMDAALHSRRLRVDDVDAWLQANDGRRGTRSVRRVLEHAEPAAESHMESRLRMLLVLGGLPRPQAQVAIYDRQGEFVGRVDLYYAEHRLGIEYDGAWHRDNLAEDNRRQNELLRAGVRLLRFTSSDVFAKPDAVVGHVRQMLG